MKNSHGVTDMRIAARYNAPMSTVLPLVPEDLTPPPQLLTRAAFAVARAHATEQRPERVAADLWPRDPNVATLTKSAVSPLALSSESDLSAPAVSDFISSLSEHSAAARLMQAGLDCGPMTGIEAMNNPWAGAADAVFIAEGAPVPVASLSFSAGLIEPKKMALILTLTRQLLNHSAAQNIFEALLKRGAARALDKAVFDATAGDSSRPAGLLNGVSSAGATTNSLFGDCRLLIDAIVSAGGLAQNVLFFTSPGRAVAARTLSNDPNLPVFGTVGLDGTKFVAVDPSGFAASIAEPQIRVSDQAVLHMEDTSPTNIGVSSSATFPVRSMFQIDGIALAVWLRCGWAAVPGLVQFVASPGW
jgi:hypothetical protein